MPFSRRHRERVVEAPPKRRGLFSRRPAHHTTTTTEAPRRRGLFSRRPAVQHHHQRKPSIGDKISGAFLKLRGSLTHRPGVKAAGTRRMHGTDGRGSHRHYY
ncbi:hypothetical protein ISF_05751 [Cordyceps fumosorosea ARSEF 2679]|uniref:Uncharacterized protein n=1 Tax=Cordyceps fumosorosea (strain ARSEF 2679) TaxID=1081104 RepID=A0A167TL64_CORFA|nr:hypothetical protein ISF_05751 [Cordyceps fumosorosea ARSEF 2679]OAA60712.1 hypothetical protein ISF_05751 [Cordyceps fumosorosea ARSEF 2679]